MGFVVATTCMCRLYINSRVYLANIGFKSWRSGRSEIFIRMEVSSEHLETMGFVVATILMCRLYISSRHYLANYRFWERVQRKQ